MGKTLTSAIEKTIQKFRPLTLPFLMHLKLYTQDVNFLQFDFQLGFVDNRDCKYYSCSIVKMRVRYNSLNRFETWRCVGFSKKNHDGRRLHLRSHILKILNSLISILKSNKESKIYAKWSYTNQKITLHWCLL